MTDFRSCEVQNGRKKCRSLVRNMMWSPKKKVFIEIWRVFPPKTKLSPKKTKQKGLRDSHADFSVWFRWAPSQAHGPSAGLPKVHGPRGHCPPLPPSRRRCTTVVCIPNNRCLRYTFSESITYEKRDDILLNMTIVVFCWAVYFVCLWQNMLRFF